jgi:septal ring factor EnvC (AmiA/AmiB activator)
MITFAVVVYSLFSFMKDAELLISGIAYKTRKLLDQYNTLKTENNILKKQNEEFKSLLKRNDYKIDSLHNEIKALKIARSIKSTGRSEEVEREIVELSREIDKCIALFNK